VGGGLGVSQKSEINSYRDLLVWQKEMILAKAGLWDD
jgi:hypothetical protein